MSDKRAAWQDGYGPQFGDRDTVVNISEPLTAPAGTPMGASACLLCRAPVADQLACIGLFADLGEPTDDRGVLIGVAFVVHQKCTTLGHQAIALAVHAMTCTTCHDRLERS